MPNEKEKPKSRLGQAFEKSRYMTLYELVNKALIASLTTTNTAAKEVDNNKKWL